MAAELGIECRCHVPSGKLSPELEAAKEIGAEIIQHRPGYNSVIIARAREDAEQRNWHEIPFGMECEEAVKQTASQVKNLPDGIKRIVVPVGSGMSLAGVLQGLIDAEIDIRHAKRWVDDPESGERRLKEVPVRFRPWWWTDESGNLILEVRYGNKRLAIRPKKAAIEIGDASNLVPTLELLKEAVEAGELDKVLITAKEERSANFRRRSKAA